MITRYQMLMTTEHDQSIVVVEMRLILISGTD